MSSIDEEDEDEDPNNNELFKALENEANNQETNEGENLY